MPDLKTKLRKLNTEGMIRTDIENLLLSEMVMHDRSAMLDEDFIEDVIAGPEDAKLFKTIDDEDDGFEQTVDPKELTVDVIY